MKSNNLLLDIYENRINEDQAQQLLDNILESSNASSVESVLGLSRVEWTAYAQGMSFECIANFRYKGWPRTCIECGRPISVENFGWWFQELHGKVHIKHVQCPCENIDDLKAKK